MIKSKFLLLAALAITVLSSCGGGSRDLPKKQRIPCDYYWCSKCTDEKLHIQPLLKVFRMWKFVQK